MRWLFLIKFQFLPKLITFKKVYLWKILETNRSNIQQHNNNSIMIQNLKPQPALKSDRLIELFFKINS